MVPSFNTKTGQVRHPAIDIVPTDSNLGVLSSSDEDCATKYSENEKKFEIR